MTDRKTLDQMTSDDLDALYEQLDELREVSATRKRIARRRREQLDQAEDLLRVAHETSNRSEAERARAVERAERAEAALTRVRKACASVQAADQGHNPTVDWVAMRVLEAIDARLVHGSGEPAPQATDGTVCRAYQPPTKPEDSGLCARCGMSDWKHAAAAEAERCCVCGGAPVVYHNHREQPFCWPCADCGCNQDVCVRTGLNDPTASQAAAQRDQLAAALAEILTAFNPVSSHNGVRIGWTAQHPIHPDDMDRWQSALPKEQP
jgi:hypothetical protein